MTDHKVQKTDLEEIMVVDDTADSLKLLAGILTDHGYGVRPASSGRLALRSVLAEVPDLILLDVKMPDMNGYEVCRRLKADEKSRKVPVIFISALDEAANKVKGFSAGGVDYITKPFEPNEVLARVKAHLSLRQMQKRLEQAHRDLEDRVRERTAELAKANEDLHQEITNHKQTEANAGHLNRILHAIRNINQLITKERDLDRLLVSACDRLIETDSYGSAWILLLNEDGTPSKFSRKDTTGHSMSLADLPQQGELMACTQASIAQAGVQIIKDGADMCQDCFLVSNIPGSSNTLVTRLEYNGAIYGAINVAVLKEYAIDTEEITLFAELAKDISFALFSVELEEKRKKAEKDLAKRTYDLGERVKELNLLHTLHNIGSDWGVSLKDILKRTVDIIPSGWQYPEVACARIRVEENEYSTDNFEETPWNQTSEIIVRGDRIGTVEVGYLEEKPQMDDRSFLEEEYDLLATISQQLGRTIERKNAEEELRKHQDHLEELVEERTTELQREIEERVQVEQELRERTEELEVFNKAMVDREMRIITLKEETNDLCKALGKDPRYPTVWKTQDESE